MAERKMSPEEREAQLEARLARIAALEQEVKQRERR